MAIDSDSTFAEVEAQYDDNSDFDIDGSVTKARLFIQACRVLLRRRPEESAQGPERVRFDGRIIEKRLNEAMEFVRQQDDSGVILHSAENYRS